MREKLIKNNNQSKINFDKISYHRLFENCFSQNSTIKRKLSIDQLISQKVQFSPLMKKFPHSQFTKKVRHNFVDRNLQKRNTPKICPTNIVTEDLNLKEDLCEISPMKIIVKKNRKII